MADFQGQYFIHTSSSPELVDCWRSGEGRFGSALFFVSAWCADTKDAVRASYVMTAAKPHTYVLPDDGRIKLARRRDLDLPDSLVDRLDSRYTPAEDA